LYVMYPVRQAWVYKFFHWDAFKVKVLYKVVTACTWKNKYIKYTFKGDKMTNLRYMIEKQISKHCLHFSTHLYIASI